MGNLEIISWSVPTIRMAMSAAIIVKLNTSEKMSPSISQIVWNFTNRKILN